MTEARFVDIPAHLYPFTVEFFSVLDPEGVNSLCTVEVSGPGAMVVPPLRKHEDDPAIWVRLSYPDGEVLESPKEVAEIKAIVAEMTNESVFPWETPPGQGAGWCAPSP